MQHKKEGSLSLTVAVTGHKDIKPNNEERIASTCENYLLALLNDYPDLSIRLLSGLAAGTDHLLVEVAINLIKQGKPIEIIGVLPLEQPHYEEDFSGEQVQAFHILLKQITEVGGKVIELSTPEKREEGYTNLATYLVNKADILVAVWNGVDNDKPGGTSHIANMALKPISKIKDSHFVGNQTQRALLINSTFYGLESLPIFVIPTERSENEKGDLFFSSAGYWVPTETDHYQTQQELDIHYRQRFETLAQLSADIKVSNKEWSTSGPVYQKPLGNIPSEELSVIEKRFRQIDGVADKLSNQVKSAHHVLISMTLLLAFSFLFYAKLYPAKSILAIYILTFLVGVAWFYWRRPNRLKTKYALYRFISESLRIEYFTYAVGIKDEIGQYSISNKLHSYGMAEIELAKSVINQVTLLGKKTQTFEANSELAVSAWLTAQRDYYRKAGQKLHKKHRFIEIALKVTVFLPIIIALSILGFADVLTSIQLPGLNADLKSFFVFMIGLIPVLGALFELQSNNDSLKELSHQYATYDVYLTNAIKSLAGKTGNDFLRLLEVISVELSSEQARWAVTTKHKSMEPPSGG